MFTTIRIPPSIPSDFIPVAEYESQTPDTFFGGKPVLHYYAANAKIWLPTLRDTTLPVFPLPSEAAALAEGSASVEAVATAPTLPEAAALGASGAASTYHEYRADIFVSSQ